MNRIAAVVDRWMRSIIAKAGSEEVIYVGVFLPPMARQRLLRSFPAEHPTTWAHHMTVWHFQDGGDVPNVPWGKTVDLKVLGHYNNDQAQAVVVAPPTGLRPVSRTPHITISTASGVSPKVSNDVVPPPGEVEPVAGLPAIKGQVGWVNALNKVHLEPPPAE